MLLLHQQLAPSDVCSFLFESVLTLTACFFPGLGETLLQPNISSVVFTSVVFVSEKHGCICTREQPSSVQLVIVPNIMIRLVAPEGFVFVAF